jgi:hypothetical protein
VSISILHHFHIPESIAIPTKTLLLLYQTFIPDSTFKSVQATIIAAVIMLAALVTGWRQQSSTRQGQLQRCPASPWLHKMLTGGNKSGWFISFAPVCYDNNIIYVYLGVHVSGGGCNELKLVTWLSLSHRHYLYSFYKHKGSVLTLGVLLVTASSHQSNQEPIS